MAQRPRALKVLELAAGAAGWGEPLPAGEGRGLALLHGFGTYVAEVAHVAVDDTGTVRVRRVTCAVDWGQPVNPDAIRAEAEGGIVFGLLSAALYGEITIADGQIEQGNFDTYPVLRIDEAPAIDVILVGSRGAFGGMGEPTTAAITPPSSTPSTPPPASACGDCRSGGWSLRIDGRGWLRLPKPSKPYSLDSLSYLDSLYSDSIVSQNSYSSRFRIDRRMER